jgi:hypothetical protein
MRVGVCGIACELCPRMAKGACPHGGEGCRPEANPYCKVASCAFERGVRTCFQCPDFPCETTKLGPISYEYCRYIAQKE